jgi:hypothetical protein
MPTKFIVILATCIPGILFPCAVCYGNPESPMSHGMNMGVLTLMGFIGFVLFMIVFSIISISIRTKNINNS